MLQSYSPEDNRFDLRQFLYNSRWPYQFRKIDDLVREVEGSQIASVEFGRQENGEIASDDGSGLGIPAAGSGNPKAGL